MAISLSQLELILCQPESPTLDFKKTFYDFTKGDERGDAALVKDICCMANTIRLHTAYILFGVDKKIDNSFEVIGISTYPDEAILQDKIKSKVYPLPQFSFYTLSYQNLTIGVIEVPIRYYEHPTMAVVKIRGMEPGKVYIRRGSSNSEALFHEGIEVSNWLKSNPKASGYQLNDQLFEILEEFSHLDKPISALIARTYRIATALNLPDLAKIAKYELQGAKTKFIDNSSGVFDYRLLTVFVDLGSELIIESSPYSAAQLKTQFRRLEHLFEQKMLLFLTIVELESAMDRSRTNKGQFLLSVKLNSTDLLPNYQGKNLPVTLYFFIDDIQILYDSIRKKFIDLLLHYC